MDEAKEVHTCLRAAGGMFKFVKVFRLNMIHFGYPFLSQTTVGMKLGYFWLILLSAGISANRPDISRRASAQRDVESAIILTL